MKVLMVSSDKRIVNPASASAQRLAGLGGLIDELVILILGVGGGVAVKLSEKVRVQSTAHNKLTAVWAARQLSGRIITLANDWLITAQDPFLAGVAGWLIKRATGSKLQLQVHTDVTSPFFRRASLANWLRWQLASFLLPRADKVRAVSERVERGLAARFKHLNISTLPVWVDVEKIKTAPVKVDLRRKYPNQFIILMASRLSRGKNIGLAIEAVGTVIREYPQVLLLVVGSGPEERKLSAISHKLKANIVLEPWTENLASYYKTADLFLLTSNYEGYGRTIVEAMAAGCPVVMTDVGLAGELVRDGENGRVVPVGDAPTLAAVLQELVSDPETRRKLAAAGQTATAQLPNWDAYRDAYQKHW